MNKKKLLPIALLGVLTTGQVGATTYAYKTLDFPGATLTGATDINDSGQIIGQFYDGDQAAYPTYYYFFYPTENTHGYLYSNGTFTQLDPSGTAIFSRPSSINSKGQIVGAYTNGVDVAKYIDYHGFIYSTGTFTNFDFPDPRTFGTQLSGINASGQIIGWFSDIYGGYASFIYNGGTAVVSLSTSNAYGINTSGQVLTNVITSGTDSFDIIKTQGANITSRTTVDVSFPNLSGSVGGLRPSAINDNGQVIGGFDVNGPSGNQRFLYNGVNTILLNVPDVNYSNTITIGGTSYAAPTHTTAYGINASGHVVGHYYLNDSPDINHGFVYDGSAYITIDVPGAVSTKALKINASGQVVGSYTDGAGVIHAFLATPVVATAPKPTKEKDCKKGGWKKFGFKNKDQCEKYVEKLKGDEEDHDDD